MRNLLFSVVAILLIIVSGCNNSNSDYYNSSPLPSISNFSLTPQTAFTKDSRTTVTVSSSTLGNGSFTVLYSLTGYNTITTAATLTMYNGSGNFLTSVLENDGPTTLSIAAITYDTYDTLYFTNAPQSSLYDSSGTMTATFTPSGGSAQSIQATDLTASLSGHNLNIQGVSWQNGYAATVYLTYDNYSGTPGTATLNSGGAAGFASLGSTAVNDTSASGTITISTVTPLLTGTFSYTNTDLSTVTGSFSCVAP